MLYVTHSAARRPSDNHGVFVTRHEYQLLRVTIDRNRGLGKTLILKLMIIQIETDFRFGKEGYWLP